METQYNDLIYHELQLQSAIITNEIHLVFFKILIQEGYKFKFTIRNLDLKLTTQSYPHFNSASSPSSYPTVVTLYQIQYLIIINIYTVQWVKNMYVYTISKKFFI